MDIFCGSTRNSSLGCLIVEICTWHNCRSHWPRRLKRKSTAARLLRSWVRIPPGAWMFAWCVCFVLSGRGLCDELITRPDESYRLWCVLVCDNETSWYVEAIVRAGLHSQRKKKKKMTLTIIQTYLVGLAIPATERSQTYALDRATIGFRLFEQLGHPFWICDCVFGRN
jgi:hypothetical protein